MQQPARWVPYCGEAPTPEAWLGRWNLDPVLLAFLLPALIALLHPGLWRDEAARRRRLMLAWAWALAMILYVSPLCALSSAFFSVRVVHHMALVLLIAPLLAIGLDPWLRRLPSPPWICTAVSAAVFWIWHAPAPYAQALSSDAVYALMQSTLLASAVLFWLAVRRAEPVLALVMILATTVQTGLLGALITFSARPLYAPHFMSASSWGISALDDQQIAGVVMWAPGSIAYLVAAMMIGWQWLREQQAPLDRPA